MDKTNVMRILDQHNIQYIPHSFEGGCTDGKLVAEILGYPAEQVFKTLVTVGNDKNNYVFVVPVSGSLNLKKAAKSVGVKSIEMIKQKDLLPLTGYIHGGCSPIGMKKQFKTVIDETACLFDTILFSAGKIGFQIETNYQTLESLIGASLFDISD